MFLNTARSARYSFFLEWVAVAAGLYALASYVILPVYRQVQPPYGPLPWDVPVTASKSNGMPGDAVNICLVGTRDDVLEAMKAAGWFRADSLRFRTGLHEVRSVLFGRAYDEAPVSSLYLWNRREDLAFEQRSGRSPRQRHHVRFWMSAQAHKDGRPLWAGAATYDKAVGFSHVTGQVTHHIDPDIDAERNKIVNDLARADWVLETYPIPGVGYTFYARNGEGDRYFTDGNMTVTILKQASRQ